MISPSILFCRTSVSFVSIRTKPPRLIQMVFRKRERSSTRTSFWSGSEQEYRQFPSALMTRAMAWVGVKDGGGVEVSSAAAKMLRFGRPILGSLNNGLISRGFWVGKIAIGLDQNVFALELELFWSSVGLERKIVLGAGETFVRRGHRP